MDDDRAWLALESMDVLYPPRSGDSPLTQFARQLSNPLPYDLEETNLAEYKRFGGTLARVEFDGCRKPKDCGTDSPEDGKHTEAVGIPQ
jgi:hypothetical protein